MNTQQPSIFGMLAVALLLLNAFIIEMAVEQNEKWYSAFAITIPLFLFAVIIHKRNKAVQQKNQLPELPTSEQYKPA